MILLMGREMMQSASVNFIHSSPNISGVTMMTNTVRGAGNSNEQQLQQAESLLPRVGSFFFKLLYLTTISCCCCAAAQSTLWLHGLQYARLLCPSLSPRVYSDSCPLMPSNRLILCHPLLSSSVFPSRLGKGLI